MNKSFPHNGATEEEGQHDEGELAEQEYRQGQYD